MNILCVIPARGGSKRIPNKKLRSVCEKPLIAYSIESALCSKLCNKVVVSTDDSQIKQIAESLGVRVIDRPVDLALDASPIDDSLRHAISVLEKEEKFVPEAVVLLQANVPVRKSGEIDEAILKLKNNPEFTSVATGYEVSQRPEWMKIVDKETGLIRPFMGKNDFYRKQDLPELYLLDGAIIVVRKEVLMKTVGVKKVHAYMGDKVAMIIHEPKYAVEIDEEADFGIAGYYLQNG